MLWSPTAAPEDHGMDLPLTEFDPSATALISPKPPALDEPLPPRAVMCFFPEIVAALTVSHQARRIGRFSAELGGGDLFVLIHDGVPVAVFHPGVGAPLAVLHLNRRSQPAHTPSLPAELRAPLNRVWPSVM